MNQVQDIDAAWNDFCQGNCDSNDLALPSTLNENHNTKCTSLYISTKTKISYLTHPIDLQEVFWKIPVIRYHVPIEGIVKKQMKFNSCCDKDLENISKYIEGEEKASNHIDQHIITHIVNPDGRIKFKDVRKISIGLCKKDIISYRCKKKSAFYNCFVIILRLMFDGSFKEFHVKVFNTGKLEIPGIQNDAVVDKILDLMTKIIRPFVVSEQPLTYQKGKCETVLINSNFKCGYLINRDKLFDVIKYKYKINCSYDPCSYPGIQSEFFYDKNSSTQTGRQPAHYEKDVVTKMSFMIFRTGSVLIVGKSTEEILMIIYDFVKNMLETEYPNISDTQIINSLHDTKEVVKKQRAKKRKIILTA